MSTCVEGQTEAEWRCHSGGQVGERPLTFRPKLAMTDELIGSRARTVAGERGKEKRMERVAVDVVEAEVLGL